MPICAKSHKAHLCNLAHKALRPPGTHRLRHTVTQLVEIVTPPLVHGNSLVPISATIIGAADGIFVRMGKRTLDRVGAPLPAFVQKRRRGGPKAMRGDLADRIAEAAET